VVHTNPAGGRPPAKVHRPKRTRRPAPSPPEAEAPFPLAYHGLDVCDGCGVRLAPGRLSGLCAGCLARLTEKALDTPKACSIL
jgi:hypothetical protein